ncbi:hypothetical protein TNCV_2217641 [Trichonephila clavipes]|nr:hypothetical protein TNCV_2217641 [Trichonephila clavipes]
MVVIDSKVYSLLVANATCLTVSYQGPRNLSGVRANCTSVVSFSFGQYDLARFNPNFEGEQHWRWLGTDHLSSPSSNLTRGLVARRLFRVPLCRKDSLHLKTYMPSPGFEPGL